MKANIIFKNSGFLLLLSFIASLIFLILLYGTIKLEKNIEKQIFLISTEDIVSISKNTTSSIKKLLKHSDNYIEEILSDSLLQKRVEEKLEVLITNNIKYSYLLYKDDKGVFRFLADGSKPEEKSFQNQKFDIESNDWNKIYQKKEAMIIHHKVLHQLYRTYLFPVSNNNQEVKLILAIDYSISKFDSINKIIGLLKDGLTLIIIIILLFIFVLILQIFKYKTIKEKSFIDSLTRVYNKNYLEENKNTIDLKNYILAVLDIDYFKKINDKYGHDVGDIVLKDLGNILLKDIRKENDIIIRYGGEEFLLLIKTKKDGIEMSLKVIQRIFENIQKKKFYIAEEKFINVTVSIGINQKASNSKNFDDAFKLADLALYEAKNSGRNNIKIYDNSKKI